MIFISNVNFSSPVYNPQTGEASAGRDSFHPAAMVAGAAKGLGCPARVKLGKSADCQAYIKFAA
jgi:hypothetical protein